jgi:parvulin-like peptidyl-prolyl isomerase
MNKAVWCLSVLMLAAPAIAAAQQMEAPVGVHMIVVRTESDANNVLDRLRAGEKFEDLAKTISTDSSARSGGYIGTFSPAELRPEFKTALQGVSPGRASSVVRIGRECRASNAHRRRDRGH